MRPPSLCSPVARLLLAVTAALMVALPLRAQLSVTDTVRLRLRDAEPVSITVASPYVHGVVIRRDSAALVLRRFDRGDSVRVPLSAIAGAEMPRCRARPRDPRAAP